MDAMGSQNFNPQAQTAREPDPVPQTRPVSENVDATPRLTIPEILALKDFLATHLSDKVAEFATAGEPEKR